MKISREEVIQVAELARLDLDDVSADRMGSQIGEVLGYVEQLRRVETTNIRPTSHALFLTNASREDEKGEHLDRALVLSNAPAAEDGNFIVPKVIQE